MTVLAEIAQINPKLSAQLAEGDAVAFLGMADVTEGGMTGPGEVRPYSAVKKGYTPFLNGDLLVAKITPCFENGKIAQAKTLLPHVFGSTEFHVIRVDETKADSRYVLHLLRGPAVRLDGERRMTGSAGQRRVPKVFLETLKIPLLPLPEQRRIAAILDQADELRSQRRRALALLDELEASLFADRFGELDASTERSVEDLLKSGTGAIRSGPFGSDLLHSEFVDDGIPVLGIDNVVQNEFSWAKPRFITAVKYEQLKRYTVRPGDVLVTIMGTVGRCAVVPDDIVTAINTKHLCCISLDSSKCLPEYLHSYFLRHPKAKQYLVSVSKGAIMAGLNLTLIRSMPVRVPPMKCQIEFVDRLRDLTNLKTLHQIELDRLDELFGSIQHRAFKGEL